MTRDATALYEQARSLWFSPIFHLAWVSAPASNLMHGPPILVGSGQAQQLVEAVYEAVAKA